MPDTTTTNLGLTKPEIGASADSWGNKINADFDLVDALFAAAGTGTSIGANVGAGKTLAVAGTLNVTGTVSGGIVAPLASPTFTGTVVLPSGTSIGPVSSTEIGYLDGVTSAVQTQLDAKLGTATAASTYAPLVSPTFTGTVVLPNTTSIGGVSAAEIVYLDGVTSNVQTQLDGKAGLASPAFTGTPTAPTAGSGTNTTQVASTAFVQQVALNNQLPLQTGNAGKFLTTDGTNASFATIPEQVYPSAGIAVSTGTGWGTSLSTPLGVSNGGTGAATLTANNVLIGNGTSAVTSVAPSTSGNVLTSNGTSWTSATPTVSGSLNATATGSLSNGSTVMINTDGTVSVVGPIITNVPSAGTAVTFNGSSTSVISAAYDSVNQKVVVAFVDSAGNPRACVGTVSGTSITFGSLATIAAVQASATSCVYDPNTQKIVVAYADGSNLTGSAAVGTVSGTTISFGSFAFFYGTQIATTMQAVYDASAQRVVIAFKDANQGYGKVAIGAVSGTNITFGSTPTFSGAGSANEISAAYDANAQKVVIVYSAGTSVAIVGTTSATNMTFGTGVAFIASGVNSTAVAYDASALKIVLVYQAPTTSFGTAVVGTVSGTSISFGTPVVFQSSGTDKTSIVYNANEQKVVISYNGTSSFGTVILGTVSGTNISFGTPAVFESAAMTLISSGSVYNAAAQKTVTAYRLTAGQLGRAVVISPTTSTPNLTSENFIGFSNAAYTNGQTATIQLVGSVNTAQSGLTAGQSYFVLTDGTLSLTAGSPSVFAGTAVAATKIIVKG